MNTVSRIRAFNRFYTRLLGLLEKSYLGSGHSLSEVRVLYEISNNQGMTARQLIESLNLDEGYLSRIVKRLETEGWIERAQSKKDRRQWLLAMSPAGHEKIATLQHRSNSEIETMLRPISENDQSALTGAMATIENVLTQQQQGDVQFHDLRTGDVGWIIMRHAELYAEEEGFNAEFEVLVAEILATYMRNHDPSCERAWIAEQGGQRLGSIFCVRQSRKVAKLRLFFLEPQARGLGLGQKMLDMCMGYARGKGYEKMVLWTHESHEAACALYRKSGFQLIDSKPERSFGQDLVTQNWQIAL